MLIIKKVYNIYLGMRFKFHITGGLRIKFMIVLLIGMFSTLLYLFNQHQSDQNIINFYKFIRIHFINSSQDTICHIPEVSPYDPSVLKYIFKPRPIICKQRQPYLTYIDFGGYLRLNESSLKENNYKIQENLWCTYQTFNKENIDDESLYFNDSLPLISPVLLQTEFVTVNCKNFASLSVYSNFHAHIPFREELKTRTLKNKKNRVNVVLFGLDSISRLNFIRQLPETYKYLMANMKSFILEGYTKVGDNTYSNLMPLLSGLHPYVNYLKESSTDDFIDPWPLIWKNFSAAGYITLFSEDRPKIAVFNYLAKGFQKTPSDYYMRPFWVGLENAHSLNWLSSHLCFGNIPRHMYLINWVGDFLKKYRNIPHFVLSFLTDLSHEHLNQINVADLDFKNLFQDLHEGGFLNQTVFIVFSDHGHRFDSIRNTVVGRLEERMPFISIYLPPWLKKKFPKIVENILYNKARLLSPYDFHETLAWFLRNDLNNLISEPKRVNLTFFDKVANDRDCNDAKIPEHYCVCQQESPISTRDVTVIKAANVLVEKLNDLLLKFGELCVKLTLDKITDAQVLLPHAEVIENAQNLFITLRVVIEVIPSHAIFESTMKYDIAEKTVEVFDDISRINRYGNQSYCINDKNIRKFCYCTIQLS